MNARAIVLVLALAAVLVLVALAASQRVECTARDRVGPLAEACDR